MSEAHAIDRTVQASGRQPIPLVEHANRLFGSSRAVSGRDKSKVHSVVSQTLFDFQVCRDGRARVSRETADGKT